MGFDAYRKWLGISSKRRPPTYYDLLGIEPGENDNETIRSALQQRRAFIKSKRGEGHDAQVAKILAQLDEAASTLFVPEFKDAYDRQLGLSRRRRLMGNRRSYVLPAWMESKIVRIYGEGSGVIVETLGIVSIVVVAIGLMVASGMWLKSQTIASETSSEPTWLERAAEAMRTKPNELESRRNNSAAPTVQDPIQPSPGSAVTTSTLEAIEESQEPEAVKSTVDAAKPATEKKIVELTPEKRPVIPNLAPIPGQSASPALIRAIDRLVTAEGVTEDSPGIAICIIQPGQWFFIKGYGRANVEIGETITPKTIFEIGSLADPMTATAVLMLQEQGKLTIEDDVRTYIPELPEYDVDHPIRLKDLLHHTSGLPDYANFKNVPARYKDFWVNEDYVESFAKNRGSFPQTFPAGEKFETNNSNYMLLSLVVARVSGKPFAQFMRDEVFSKVGMVETFVYENPRTVRTGSERQASAVGYSQATGDKWRPTWGLPPNRRDELLTVGDRGVWTNLEDLVRWDMAWRFGKFLKPETAMSMIFPSQTRDGKTNAYGLGFEIYPNNMGGLVGFGHEGARSGFRNSYYRYLLTDRSTIFLSNRENFDMNAFWYKLNDAVEKTMNKR